MRNTVSRTFTKISATALVYVDGKVAEQVINIPYLYNTEELAAKYIRRHVKNGDAAELFNLTGKLIDVVSVKKLETLYGMDEQDFIKIAKPVDERSKETRGMVSKTIVGYVGTLLYMDEKRNVCNTPVLITKGVKLDKIAKDNTPKGCYPITIENVKETETLFVVNEQTFIENAREMSDHQHYIVK